MVLYDYSGNEANGAKYKRGCAYGLLIVICRALIELPVDFC
ncbi:MAG: hypothetical protein ABSB25_02150 [Sedimentisphaerales bacterium]